MLKIKIRKREYTITEEDLIVDNGFCIQVPSISVLSDKFYYTPLIIPNSTWNKIQDKFYLEKIKSNSEGDFLLCCYKLLPEEDNLTIEGKVQEDIYCSVEPLLKEDSND